MKLTRDFPIVLPGDVYPTTLPEGGVIADLVPAEAVAEVEAIAVAAGCAETPKPKKAATEADKT